MDYGEYLRLFLRFCNGSDVLTRITVTFTSSDDSEFTSIYYLHHHQPVKSSLHSSNSFISTSQPLLCKPAEARVTKWQNQWEATQSNLNKYDIHPKEQHPSGDTLPWWTWRTANRVRSGQAATPTAKHLWGYRENKHTCDLNHIMTSCTHFREIPSKDDIAEMEGRAVWWMSAVADTIWWAYYYMILYYCWEPAEYSNTENERILKSICAKRCVWASSVGGVRQKIMAAFNFGWAGFIRQRLRQWGFHLCWH